MAKNEKQPTPNEQKPTIPENAYPVFVPYQNEKKILIVCEVCGHANPQYTALCEKCSNYLTK